MTAKTYIATDRDPITRLAKLIFRLCRGDVLTARNIRDQYGVSWATAKRDLVRLEQALPCVVDVPDPDRCGRRYTKKLSLMEGFTSLKLLQERAADVE